MQNSLPKQQNKSQEMMVQEVFSGPLPHPSILEKYEQVVPGAAERIFKSFENQTEHRHKIEKSVIKTQNRLSIVGLVFGFIIAMTTIIGGIYTVLKDRPLLGGALSFSGLAILVGAFLLNKKNGQK